jgi:hypothetical protein
MADELKRISGLVCEQNVLIIADDQVTGAIYRYSLDCTKSAASSMSSVQSPVHKIIPFEPVLSDISLLYGFLRYLSKVC